MKTDSKISKLLRDKRWCYFIPPQTPHERGYIPALVIEGEKGYHMMSGNGEGTAPWYWGPTEADAIKTAEEINARMGITTADQLKIVLSSMPGNF